MTNEIVPQEASIDQILQGPEGDLLKRCVERMLAQAMETEVTSQIGATLHERADGRLAYRNGYREREFETRVGSLTLAIPKLRSGTFFPSFLEPRRRAERALVAVVQEAFLHGTSSRKVDDLVQALGGPGIDKSRVSRMCAELDEEVQAFRTRTLEEETPYLWLDAVYEKAREGGRVRSKAVVIATGVTSEGRRTVLGVDAGDAESHAFWKDFLRSLLKRGLKGVQLAISDAHEGLKRAISETMADTTWQRCRVHAMRSLLTHVPRGQQGFVLAAVKTVFVQASKPEARAALGQVVKLLEAKCPKAAELLSAMADDVLAYMAFPQEHWRQIHSTNPLERLNREIRRRTRVVGIFPNVTSLLRLVTMLLAEQDDEWQAAEKAYFSRRSMAKVSESVLPPPDLIKEIATA